MKTLLIFLASLLLIGCVKTELKPKSYPQWYKNRELHSKVKFEVIGYGEGRSVKEAEASAKENIALTLLSRVDSSFSSLSTDNKTKNEAKLKVTSKLNLQNLQILKQEHRDGNFFVALMYENLDLAYRVKKGLADFECKKIDIDSYILKTPLVKKITTTLDCALDFKLDRKNSAWYLKYRDSMFLLNSDEFEDLYVNSKNEHFEFKASKSVLVDGDSFYFTINSKQRGYITILNVYENGIVTLLQPSKSFEKTLQIPSKSSENYFEAGVILEGVDTYDLYVAIFTKKPLDMSRFEYADEDLASNELAYKFDELIELMSKYEYASILLRTRAK